MSFKRIPLGLALAVSLFAQQAFPPRGGVGGTGAPNAASVPLVSAGTVIDIPHIFSASARVKAVIQCYTSADALITAAFTKTYPDAATIRLTFGASQAIGSYCNANATGTGSTGATGATGAAGPIGTLQTGAGLLASGPPEDRIVEVDCTQVPCKYAGSGAPGTITGATAGDPYTDTATGITYIALSANFATWARLARSDVKTTFSGGVNLGSLSADPGSPSNGDSWYNTTLGKFRCREAGSSKDCDTGGTGASFNPLTTEEWYETFGGGNATTGQIGNLGWLISGSAVAPTYATEAGAPSYMRRSTGTTATTVTTLTLGADTSSTFTPSDTFDLTWRVRSSNATNVVLRVGATCGAASGNPPADGVYFEKLTGDTNWHRVSRATSETRADTGTAVSTGWIRFRIRRVDASTIGFTINGGSESSITTNIPTAGCRPWTQAINATTTADTLDHDYFFMTVGGLSR